MALDMGAPISVLAGVHPGCPELFDNRAFGPSATAKARPTAVPAQLEPAYLPRQHRDLGGADPRRINWSFIPEQAKRLLAETDRRVPASTGLEPPATSDMSSSMVKDHY
jgi:hypothetical protein